MTACAYLLSVGYHMTAYIVMQQPSEAVSHQIAFIAIQLLVHTMSLCLNYFLDMQKKSNFLS